MSRPFLAVFALTTLLAAVAFSAAAEALSTGSVGAMVLFTVAALPALLGFTVLLRAVWREGRGARRSTAQVRRLRRQL